METVGMILCGGFGKRLRPVTETVPKPLVEISEDYTILDKQLFDFKNAGVNEVYLLAGFLHEKIEERYGDEYKGVKIHYVIEDEPLGTLNAIRLGMEEIDGDKQCIIRNGDIVSDVNLKAMIEYGVKSSLPVIMFVTQMQSPYGIVEMNGDRLVSFKEKPILEDYYINGGIYFTKSKIDFGEFETGDIEKPGDLSDGEKLCLGLCFMSALHRISGFDLPIVMDTPLGNLDVDMRQNIAKFLPEFVEGKQIILLVTGTEYTSDFRDILYHNIGKEYTIHWDNSENGKESKVILNG